jgi:histidinol-phosphate aminotransferase
MNDFWSDGIRDLEPYVPGEQPVIAGLIKLNTNENPYPPSPTVLSAIRKVTDGDLRLYPDPESLVLKRSIAELHGVSPNYVFVGNGSDEVLAHAYLALLKHNLPVLFPDITYSFYPVYCKLYGIAYSLVPLNAQFQVCIENYSQPMSLYPGSMTVATSWCTRDRQDRHPSPVDSLHAFGSTGLPGMPLVG